MTYILLAAGLVLLIAGGELVVRGSARLALAFGVSPLIIGLTVVAFGTSSPELAVSVQAGMTGNSDIAIGNVIGSNIFNVLFILGVSALIVPLAVSHQLIRIDVPVMIGISLALLAFAWDGRLMPLEGAVMAACLAGYIALQVFIARRAQAPDEVVEPYQGRWWVEVALIIGGLALLMIGSGWLVDGAVSLARSLGVTELVIGLTIVAAGTSMPEVATSVIAGLRGQRDIAVGNVIGSNIFNILAVLGLTTAASVQGIGVSNAALAVDLPIMVGVAALCLPIFLSGHTISRWEGALFLGYYMAYVVYLLLDAAEHDGVKEYGSVMLWVVVPITVLTVMAFTLHDVWRRRQHRG